MASAYNIIEYILHADKKTVIVTWDTLHIMLTLLILIALIILIWLSRLNKCMENEWKFEDVRYDCDIPKCIDADKSMFVSTFLVSTHIYKYCHTTVHSSIHEVTQIT